MKIILLGAPGCGKGTQGGLLATHYKIPEISTGSLLRQAVADVTPLGKIARAVMDAGQLVSDEIILGIIRDRLSQDDVKKGFILDGFPRNMDQSDQLDEMLEQLGLSIDLAVLIETDLDLLMQRLLGRRTCRSCGTTYNMFFAPPKMDDSCDECGGRLVRRPDDNEEIISNRMRIYDAQTKPVIERYREQQRLRVVQGVGDIQDVFSAVQKSIEEVKSTFGKRDRSEAIRQAVVRKRAQQDEAGNMASAKAKGKVVAVKKTALKKKAVVKKKAVAKKAAVTKKKVVVKKKTVAKKKTLTKKKAVVKKKAVARKKIVTKKKVVVKKKAATKKKVVTKKKVAKKKSAKKRK